MCTFAGLGNAVGLLRNIQLGALQYQAAIAQIIEPGSIKQSSLSDIHTQIEKQRFAGILFLGYCIEGQSCAVAIAHVCSFVATSYKAFCAQAACHNCPCLVCSLQKILP